MISELYEVRKENKRIVVGARVTLSQLRREVEKTNPEFARFLNLFASPQIKNAATLVGNIANASPIGDTLPFLLVSRGKVHAASIEDGAVKRREISFPDLFLGYKKLALEPSEIITHVSFDETSQNQILKIYKVSQRKDLDISTVSGAFLLKTVSQGTGKKIEEARLAFGGVAATPVRLPEAEKALQGKVLDSKLIQEVSELIGKTIAPQTDLRGSKTYRKVLAMNLFKRYGREVLHG